MLTAVNLAEVPKAVVEQHLRIGNRCTMNQDDFIQLVFTELRHFHQASLALVRGFQNYWGPSPQANTQACNTNSFSRGKVPLPFHLHDINLLLLISSVSDFNSSL